jgi:hypothetical protein
MAIGLDHIATGPGIKLQLLSATFSDAMTAILIIFAMIIGLLFLKRLIDHICDG